MKRGPEQAKAIMALLVSAILVANCIYIGGHRLQDAYMYFFSDRPPFEKITSDRLVIIRRATGMMGRGRGNVVWIVRKDHEEIAILAEKLPPEFYLVRRDIDDVPIKHVAGGDFPAYMVVNSPTRFLLGQLLLGLMIGIPSGFLFIAAWRYLKNPAT